ncbi:MAG: ATP-binding protein [Bacteroidia bacterium]|nr:ATP-binding protein [Bacteroidia bacterium]
MKSATIRKIAIVGPESTGKSTLAAQLARELGTVWVPEFAREYLENLARPYEQKDLLAIAKGQLALEENQLSKANGLLICDTNLLVIQIWSSYKYGSVSKELQGLIQLEAYELHLLTDIDLPWEFDPMRENPDLKERQELFEIYKNELLASRVRFTILTGNEQQRLKKAMAAIGA